MKKLLLFLIAVLPLPLDAFTTRYVRGIRSPSCPSSSTMIMYFDDISRRGPAIPWTPIKNSKILFASMPKPKKPSLSDYTSEKLNMLQRHLRGYDAKSAGALTSPEVKQAMSDWIDLEGSNIGYEVMHLPQKDEIHSSIVLNNSTSVIECYRDLWEHIHEHARTNAIDRNENDIEFIVFQNCPDLYNYETMNRIAKDLQSCSEYCEKFGKDFFVCVFHPNYGNEPKMLSPERHSPLPCFGIHKKTDQGYDYIDDIELTSLVGVEKRISSDGPDRDNEVNSLFLDMKNMDAKREGLEALFNSDAAIKFGNTPVGRATHNDRCSDENIIAITKDWIMYESSKGTNQAMKYAETIGDRWTVSNSVTGESFYREMWSMIHQLEIYQSTTDDAASPDYEKKTTSSMFIATHFSMHNAQKFKSVAILINKALKRLYKKEMCMELFHPEFVGKNDGMSEMRRSPFPALQVTYMQEKKITDSC